MTVPEPECCADPEAGQGAQRPAAAARPAPKGVRGAIDQFLRGPPDVEDCCPDEPLVRRLRAVIRGAVRVLAVMMTAVILWGVIDVGYVIWERLVEPPIGLLKVNDILASFGAFMAVLIAIEIFINITIYLRDDVIHVRIVMATALMAIARKVIVLDFDKLPATYVWATAGVVLAMSAGYWVTVVLDRRTKADRSESL